jgi:hypothetical protein
MTENTNISYVKREEPTIINEDMLNEMASHPLFQPLVDMIEEAVNKDYEGGIVIQNCFPQEWSNVQVGFMIYSIEKSYPQVQSAEFYGDNGMYIYIKNKKSPLVTDFGLPILKKV